MHYLYEAHQSGRAEAEKYKGHIPEGKGWKKTRALTLAESPRLKPLYFICPERQGILEAEGGGCHYVGRCLGSIAGIAVDNLFTGIVNIIACTGIAIVAVLLIEKVID